MKENDNKPEKVLNIVKVNNDIFSKTKEYFNNLKSNYNSFNDILESFALGTTKVELRKRYLESMVDEAWVKIVEDTLPSIDAIIRSPSGNLVDDEEVKPIELTRKVVNKSVVHLSMHTDLINEIKDDGQVMPAKLLNVLTDESAITYENKFINTLILRLFSFVMLRYDKALNDLQDGMNTQFTYFQSFQNGDTKNKISITLETTENPKDVDKIKNYLYTSDLWRRVEKITDWCKTLISSKFVKEMGKNYIHPPVIRTNKLLKNVDFCQCLSLWEFLETYEVSGYETKVHESVEEVDETFLSDFYNSVVSQYIIFQNELGNKFIEKNTLDERDININASVTNELLEPNEDEYAITSENIPELDHFFDEREEEIDFAIRVALEADKEMYTGDDYIMQPKLRIIYKYNYSYLARLILAQDPTLDYYTEIKNKLLSYDNVKSKISWKHESFTYKREKCALLLCKGKTLHIYLPLDPNLYVDTKYNFNLSKTKDSSLCLDLKITSNRQTSYACELIETVMANKGISAIINHQFIDYHLMKHTVEEMCKMKPALVKRLGEKAVEEVKQVLPPIKDLKLKYHYIYSFMARLIMAQDPAQAYYSEIKNELLAHENVKTNISFKHEQFSSGRVKICRLRVKGKTLCVYLPLDPNSYKDTGFKVNDMSDVSEDENFPMMLKLNTIKNTKFAIKLINKILDENSLLALPNPSIVDYHMDYKTPEELCQTKPPLAKKIIFSKKHAKEMVKKKYKIVRIVGANNVQTIKNVYKEEETIIKEVTKRVVEHVNIIRYNLSHMAKYIRAQYPMQDYYTQIKNKLMSYEGMNNRISWHHEIFWYESSTIAKFVIKGKTLNVFLPLNPLDYQDSKYKYSDVSSIKSYENLPFLMKISSPRKAKHVIELITNIADSLRINEKKSIKFIDYHKPYKTIEQLLAMEPPLAKMRTSKNNSSKIEKPITNNLTLKTTNKAKYNNSFIFKLKESGRANMKMYSNLKNNFLSYKNVICGEAWSHEEYTYKDDVLFELEVNGKILSLILHDDYKNYLGSKYHIKALLDENKEVIEGRALLEISSKKAYIYALELFNKKCSLLNIKQGEIPRIDYVKLIKTSKELNMLKRPFKIQKRVK